nr:PREDICTED: mucin-13 [Rhinolophus sinicus]
MSGTLIFAFEAEAATDGVGMESRVQVGSERHQPKLSCPKPSCKSYHHNDGIYYPNISCKSYRHSDGICYPNTFCKSYHHSDGICYPNTFCKSYHHMTASAAPTPSANPTATTAPTSTAVSSVTSSDVTSSNTNNPNPDTTGLCQKDSCGGDSSCVNLSTDHFCLCVEGYYYNSSKCNKGMIFPGKITVSISDTSNLEDKMSAAYQRLHIKVIKFFEGAFIKSTFGQTVIQDVRISPSARSEMRADGKGIDVTVVNLFPETTKENETSVSDAISKAISQGNSEGVTGYTKQDRCEFYGCVKDGNDDCSNGLQCKCKEGLERPNPQIAFCLAKCPDTCNEKHNKQCLVKDNKGAHCVCLPGYQEDAHGNCQECAFGYSGVDCKDPYQLILTIVGSVAGILLLGMLIALISMRSKKQKATEEQNLIENDFQNLTLQQHTTGFSNPGADMSVFPKVRTTFSRDRQWQNPYEASDHRGMPRPDY